MNKKYEDITNGRNLENYDETMSDLKKVKCPLCESMMTVSFDNIRPSIPPKKMDECEPPIASYLVSYACTNCEFKMEYRSDDYMKVHKMFEATREEANGENNG